MKTVKLRLDYSAHQSVVVEVPDDENQEVNAIAIAYEYLASNGVCPMWELEDEGISEDDVEDAEPVNDIDEVNYPHLKEGASSFTDAACSKTCLRIEAPSPEA